MVRCLRISIVLLWTLSGPPAIGQVGTGTIRVAPSGADAPGCGSVAAPCSTLQFAVDQFPLDGAGVVQVAAGTYVSAQPNEVVRVQGRRLTIAGGYTAAFDSAEPDANPVVIDGENARRGVSVGTAPGIDVNALTLTGVTITRGRAPAEMAGSVLSHFGGGIDATAATVLLIDVDLIDNHALGDGSSSGLPGDAGGGGVNLRQSVAFLSRVTFDGNSATGGDGSGSAPRGGLGVGGALFSYESRVTLNGITATNNVARGGDAPAGAGFGGNGGQRADALGGFWALILGEGAASHVTAVGNLAEGGQAGTLGGLGIGGAICIEAAEAPVALRSLDLRQNVARGGVAGSVGGSAFGGGLFTTDSRVAIETSRIVGNHARGVAGVTEGGTAAGGGIGTDSSRPQPAELRVTNTVVARNSAEAAEGGSSLGLGGGIFLQCPESPLGCPNPSTATSTATLVHVTLADNTVSGGLYNQGAALYVQRNSELRSYFGIVSGHAGLADPFGDAVIVRAPALAHFESTLWHGNTLNSFVEPPSAILEDVAPVAGSPSYVDPAGDPPDYHLGAASAAIGQAVGSNTRRDFDGMRRETGVGGASDLGADERTDGPAPPLAERLLASVFADGTLLEIDPATGTSDALGIGPRDLVGLAAREGRLFGLWQVDQLIELDPATGAAIGTSQPGIGVGNEGDVAIRDDGYALAIRHNGVSAELWRFQAAGDPSPALLQASLADTLDGLVFAPGGGALGLTEPGTLVLVDANTGAISPIGSTGLTLPGTAAIAVSSSGALYAAAGDSLYAVDPATAATALIGPFGNGPFASGGIAGLAFVPEPNAAAQAATVVAALAAAARRRARRAS